MAFFLNRQPKNELRKEQVRLEILAPLQSHKSRALVQKGNALISVPAPLSPQNKTGWPVKPRGDLIHGERSFTLTVSLHRCLSHTFLGIFRCWLCLPLLHCCFVLSLLLCPLQYTIYSFCSSTATVANYFPNLAASQLLYQPKHLQLQMLFLLQPLLNTDRLDISLRQTVRKKTSSRVLWIVCQKIIGNRVPLRTISDMQ